MSQTSRTLVILGGADLVPRADEPLTALLPEGAPPGRAGQLGRMDRLCALAALAVERALASRPGLTAAPAWQPEQTGVLFGSSYGCHKTDELYLRSALDGQPSPRLFAYTLPSSPVGEVSILHGLTGPGLAVVSGRTAGLEALAEAQGLLGAACSACLVVAAEVADPALPPGLTAEPLGDAAAALVVAAADSELARAHPASPFGRIEAVVCGRSDDGPGAAARQVADEARRAAAQARGDRPAELQLVCDPVTARLLDGTLGRLQVLPLPAGGAADGLGALLALGAQAERLALPAALVLCADPAGQAACALWRC
ncbi:MAG: beta-ketoacyl synthase N-terminal-like domain-containing protein [Polyangia bacterium]